LVEVPTLAEPPKLVLSDPAAFLVEVLGINLDPDSLPGLRDDPKLPPVLENLDACPPELAPNDGDT